MAKSIFDFDNKFYCNNCGIYGHKTKDCTKPISSYGIILYEKKETNIRYLLIRRKDTIAYIHLISGKYASDDINYIQTLLSELTTDEKNRIINMEYEDLWDTLWLKKKNIDTKRNEEFTLHKIKFERLRSQIRDNTNYNQYFTIEKWKEPEWGFPKGRRNFKEKDLNAAKREFVEETNIKLSEIRIKNMKPLVEQYISTDNLEYMHTYFIAEYHGNGSIVINEKNKNQMKEVSDIGFFTFDECKERIRDYHTEKLKIIDILHQILNEKSDSNKSYVNE